MGKTRLDHQMHDIKGVAGTDIAPKSLEVH